MSSPDREKMPYRDCVGVAVFNREGKVFIGRRKPEEDPEDSAELGSPWQMPQGGIDKGEDPREAALRELFEETSIRSVELIAEAPGWIYYDLPDEVLWQELLNQMGPGLAADGDDDGDVDADDYTIWSQYFGNTLDFFDVYV